MNSNGLKQRNEFIPIAEAVWALCVLFVARQASAGHGGGWQQHQQPHVPVKYVVKHVHKPVPVAKHVPVPHYVPVPKYIPVSNFIIIPSEQHQ